MNSKVFEDEHGKIWIVTRRGTSLEVKGRRNGNQRLHDIAKSCARQLGITHTKYGAPLENINEHRRIWNAIWFDGRPT